MLSFVEKGGLVDPSNSGCHGERPQQLGKRTAVLENERVIWEILPKSPDGDSEFPSSCFVDGACLELHTE